MNILISSNSEYIDKYETMLCSLRKHHQCDITVYFLNYRVPVDIILQFKDNLKSKYEIELNVINVKDMGFESFPLRLHLSIETYFRVYAQFFMPVSVKRVLWLDADIIVLNSIIDFYNTDFESNYYVVCADRINHTESGEALKANLNLPSDHIYFNAGVMLMNIESLRENTNIDSIATQCEALKDKVKWLDQDLLNKIYCNNLKYAEAYIYNYQLKSDTYIPKSSLSNIAILHYNSPIKPWNYNEINPASVYYWRTKGSQGNKEKQEAKNIYKNKIIDSFSQLKDYVKGYFSI